jgi:hypothetical protein
MGLNHCSIGAYLRNPNVGSYQRWHLSNTLFHFIEWTNPHRLIEDVLDGAKLCGDN